MTMLTPLRIGGGTALAGAKRRSSRWSSSTGNPPGTGSKKDLSKVHTSGVVHGDLPPARAFERTRNVLERRIKSVLPVKRGRDSEIVPNEARSLVFHATVQEPDGTFGSRCNFLLVRDDKQCMSLGVEPIENR